MTANFFSAYKSSFHLVYCTNSYIDSTKIQEKCEMERIANIQFSLSVCKVWSEMRNVQPHHHYVTCMCELTKFPFYNQFINSFFSHSLTHSPLAAFKSLLSNCKNLALFCTSCVLSIMWNLQIGKWLPIEIKLKIFSCFVTFFDDDLDRLDFFLLSRVKSHCESTYMPGYLFSHRL